MAFTFFFRDSQTLELAIDDALPGLADLAAVHVWDAGCAHGPEPYTLAMLLRERMEEQAFRSVRIHATDIDASFAPQVTSGIFSEAEVKRVPPEIVAKYFRPARSQGFVEVVPELRNRVAFSHHDLLSLAPIREGLRLIVCKNVLLHFGEAQRVEVLGMFYEALQPGGTLVMEHTQKLPEALANLFQQVAPYAQVYRKADRAFSWNRCESAVAPPHGERREKGYRQAPQLAAAGAQRNCAKT